MPKNKQKNINFLTTVFNIRPDEWRNIALAWTIRFLYKFGFVIGWSVLVVLFVSNFGIKSLPILFVLNAAFSVLGTLFYSLFVDKISNTALMIWSVFLSGLFLSTSMFFY